MKKSIWFVVILTLVSALVLAACGGGGDTTSEARANPPADYANLTNPVAGNADAATAGQALFSQNCASCHGETGKGDGPAAASLDPKPRDLSQSAGDASEAYIHWVIAEGGPAANLSSSMPAFKGVLTDEQIWQMVTYIETLN